MPDVQFAPELAGLEAGFIFVAITGYDDLAHTQFLIVCDAFVEIQPCPCTFCSYKSEGT
jgi:hypothetical protein